MLPVRIKFKYVNKYSNLNIFSGHFKEYMTPKHKSKEYYIRFYAGRSVVQDEKY